MKPQHILIFALVATIMILAFIVVEKNSRLEKIIVQNDYLNNINQQLMAQQGQPKKQVWYRKTEIGFKPQQES